MTRIYTFCCLFFLAFCFPLSATQIANLKTEYAETPLGIDVEKPRFSWIMQSDVAGAAQRAYQIVVTDENGETVWNTGKVNSDISLNIRYEGRSLKPQTRYHWYLDIWNEKNRKISSASWFETGLMNGEQTAWSGAKWIGGGDDDLPLYAHYLPVFRIDYALQFDEQTKSTKAGFIFGANDARLMNKNMNIFQLESPKDSAYCMLEIDISSTDEASLNIYRVGFHPNDNKNEPFRSFPIPATAISSENRYGEHKISFTIEMGTLTVFINQAQVARLGINPLGQGGDFIAFPMVGDVGFCVPPNQKVRFSDIEIRNYRVPNAILAKIDDATIDGGNSGVFVTHNPSRNSMPMLRTAFDADFKIAKARLYVTARGVYDFYINGSRVGVDYFNPGKTQYNKTHLYQTFDVTDLLRDGKNAMGAILGEGWWSGAATYSGSNWNFFGDRQSLLAKLVITDTAGNQKIIVTNPENWEYFNDGAVVYGSFFQGEVYDARKEAYTDDWSTATYDASKWKKAHEIPLTGTIALDENNFGGMKLVSQNMQSVRQMKELTAQSVEEVRPGVFVYDMGQNMVGVPKITLNGLQPGQIINLRFAEVKYPDLPAYQDNVGMIMLENIRAAMAQDIYIAKGGNEIIQPRFTFHGYRFIEITGIDAPLPLEAVKGVVTSSVHELTSSYQTSNQKVNKLWENITWSTYGNFLSIPTDCPQRNERMGWSGDISVFASAATYLADLSQFLRLHMLAMRDTQREDGRFPDVAPLDVGFGGILWGIAGITVAWEVFQQYDEKDLLAEHYEAMKRYINYILEKNIDPATNILVQENPGAWGNLGDWLAPEDDKNDRTLMWEAYFIYSLELMKKMALVLNKNADAEMFANLYNERKTFFIKTYISNEGKTIRSSFRTENTGAPIETQTSYVLPLAFNIIPNENKRKVVDNFVKTITREDKTDFPPYSLLTGFIGTASISRALSDNGHSDAAYRLLQQTSYPSWLYSVEQGATTIWERLNSYTHTDGFGGNNRMNSFNHYSFGAVASWMYTHSLGIQRDENFPGFKRFIIKPEPDPTGEMLYAKGHYDSMYGRIESAWEVKDNHVQYSFTVPANTTATLYIEAASQKEVRSGKKAFKSLKGVKYLGVEDGRQIFRLEAGRYVVISY